MGGIWNVYHSIQSFIPSQVVAETPVFLLFGVVDFKLDTR